MAVGGSVLDLRETPMQVRKRFLYGITGGGLAYFLKYGNRPLFDRVKAT